MPETLSREAEFKPIGGLNFGEIRSSCIAPKDPSIFLGIWGLARKCTRKCARKCACKCARKCARKCAAKCDH